MRINNNLMAMNTHRQLGTANTQSAKSIEKLSSGYRINRAGDDAAGLAISEKMRGQIRGLNQASSNAQDGISLIQTAEGALNETHAILQRMRELSVQAASDTNVEADRGEIQKELTQLTEEIDRIATTTEFNTMKLVNGDRAAGGVVKSKVNEVKTKADYADLSFAEGVVVTGEAFKINNGDASTPVDNEITIDSALAFWDTDAAGTITIEKLADGELKVNITAAGGTLDLASEDIIKANDNGDFVYSAHGVEFTIGKDDFAENAVGDKTVITVADTDAAAGKKAIANDFTTNTTTGDADEIATVTGIEVDRTKADGFESATEVVASWENNILTVTLKNGDNILSTDVINDVTHAAAYDYDNHGVKFTLTLHENSEKVVFTKALETEEVDKEVTNDDKSLKFQVGANENQSISLSIADMGSAALKVNAIKVDSHDNAKSAIETVNKAIETVSAERSKLGAVQNRLEHTIKNLDTSSENLQAAESRIRDVDMAKEMMEQTKQNILAQASTAMLAQANQAPQAVLQLLR